LATASAGRCFARFTLALAACTALPLLALAACVIAVDPYYVFGSPTWTGFNKVRPFYERQVLVAKPYQVRRLRPSAVALGSSRVEVGIDPHHGGWTSGAVFNFALPGGNSYTLMLSFLHAEKMGRPLKQAVIGLDFFGFNFNIPGPTTIEEKRFAGGRDPTTAQFLEEMSTSRKRRRELQPEPEARFDEALYLAVNPDVAAELARKTFASAREHWERWGRVERRNGDRIPREWREDDYLVANPDVAAAVSRGAFLNGYHHYLAAGRVERRPGAFQNWEAEPDFETASEPDIPAPASEFDEALYLAVNPDISAAIARKEFASGREHWEKWGRSEHRRGSRIPPRWHDDQYLAINRDVAAEVSRGTFLNGYHHYLANGHLENRLSGFRPRSWNEAEYLALNSDVAAAVQLGLYGNGYHHYLLSGQKEGRSGGYHPKGWDERAYLQANNDVLDGIARGTFASGFHHYMSSGRAEKRIGGLMPEGWNEQRYLAMNPDARVRIEMGTYRTGFIHYAAIGRARGYLGGMPSETTLERLRLRWRALNELMLRLDDAIPLVFSTSAAKDSISTIARQRSAVPVFDADGMRIWEGQDDELRRVGGTGKIFRAVYVDKRPGLWLPNDLPYSFINPETGMSAFDPFRFMLRRAYAQGVDARLYITPNHAIVRQLLINLQLGEQYEFWLKELVRINEEEASFAGRPPMPLWDFSSPNTITREPLPAAGDLATMRWYWEYSHYRRATGDLILDRIFDYRDPTRELPDDFGTRLTTATIEAHLVDSRARIAKWSADNAAAIAPQVISAAPRTEATKSPD
jgi:hypothetical protein